MRVTISGPLYDASGYAYHTRTFALHLAKLGVEVSLRGHPWGAARVHLDRETEAALEEMQRRPEAGAMVYVTVANSFQKQPGRPCVGWTMLETDRITPMWTDLCNAMEQVWVPTEFNRETFARSGVDPGRLAVVPLGTDPERFRSGVPPLRLPGRRGFAFLSNFEWVPRKGYDILLRAYLQEFSAEEDVTLIVKTYDNTSYDPDGGRIKAEIMDISRECGSARPPHMLLMTRVLPPEHVPSLYAAADCYVLPTRGEGWNHPALEASAMGIPVITTAWSGHLAFLHEGNSYLIPIRGLEPVPAYGVPNDQVYAGSQWAVPSLEDTRRLMRHVFHNREEARAKARQARQAAQALTWEHSARVALEQLARLGGGEG